MPTKRRATSSGMTTPDETSWRVDYRTTAVSEIDFKLSLSWLTFRRATTYPNCSMHVPTALVARRSIQSKATSYVTFYAITAQIAQLGWMGKRWIWTIPPNQRVMESTSGPSIPSTTPGCGLDSDHDVPRALH
jgi:hypothetical protein